MLSTLEMALIQYLECYIGAIIIIITTVSAHGLIYTTVPSLFKVIYIKTHLYIYRWVPLKPYSG